MFGWIKKKLKDRKVAKLYELIPDEQYGNAIRLLSGPYDGTIYAYGSVQIIGQTKPPTLRFTYDLIQNPKNIRDMEVGFINVAGDVLTHIIQFYPETYGFMNPKEIQRSMEAI